MRVLIVEDDRAIAEIASMWFEEMNYEVYVVYNAYDAISILERDKRFDLMFSDVNMPGMSGIELAHIVRELLPNLPILLTTGSFVNMEGFVFVEKPYDLASLEKAVSEFMGAL